MPDAIFDHPRLAALYDAMHPERDDLDAYLAIAEEFGARTVLDVGCGTGVFALLLAARGIEVTGVDPAGASLAVARARPGAEAARWIHGYATSLPLLEADLATMTGNAAQAIIDPVDWSGTLSAIHGALRPGGRLAFETRDPRRRPWKKWNRETTEGVTEIAGVGAVRTWLDILSVDLPLLTFRWTWEFANGGDVLTSDSTLRFRERDEIEHDLRARGFRVDEVRDAPDRPGLEFVFIASRTE